MTRVLVPIVLGAVLLSAPPAWGAPMACSPRDAVLDQLSARFHEAPVAVGLANNGALLELLTAGKGETWTIIVTMPNGVSCLVAAGSDWQEIAAPVTGDPA